MRDKGAEEAEEEMYSILNELDIEKTVLENTLSQPQEKLDKYPEYLLEQYEEELEMFKRTINYIEKLQKENEDRKSEIEIFYKWLSFTCKELGISEDTPIIAMLNEFKNNYIPKSKIKNLKEELNNFDISFYDKETLKEAVSNSLKELLGEE